METSRGLDQLRGRVVERGLCAACGACVDICPYVTAFKGKTVLLDRCSVEYGRCFAYCPMAEFDAEKTAQLVFGGSENGLNLGHVRSVMASRSLNPQITSVAQGGGTVSTVLARALEDQFIEAAILTGFDPEQRYPCGKVATTLHEIFTCAGSKYVGAHSLAAFRKAINMGFRRIGVVGLPCQVRALRKMALYDLKNENLNDRIRLVIGLFCNWAFSSRDFEVFLSARYNLQTIKKLHIPPPPANSLELETDQGMHTVSLDELKPFIQDACWHCPDMTSEYADISVGMYEGRQGWNTLIVRTEIGEDLVERARSSGWLETESFPGPNLEHLEKASIGKKERITA